MFYSNDPVSDFQRHDIKQQAMLNKLPRCCECDEPIQDEFCYEINDELICKDCMDNNHMKYVEETFT